MEYSDRMDERRVDMQAPDLIDRKFALHRGRYVLQAVLAAVTLGVLLVAQNSVSNAAIITGIAASVFIAFLYPSSKLSQPRRLVGGHALAVAVGLLFRFVADDAVTGLMSASSAKDLCAALAVGVGILAMATTDTEHPPAAGTLLGMIYGNDVIEAGALLLGSAAALSLVKHWLRDRLIDLL